MHLHQPAATKRGGDPQRMLICLEVLSTKPFRGNETPAELIDRSLAHDMHVTVTARTIRALARASGACCAATAPRRPESSGETSTASP